MTRLRYDGLEPMPASLEALEARIMKIKATLGALGDLRPGTLSEQDNVCGKPACRCKATPPQKHGPYYQVSFTWRGQSQSQFVRREDIAAVRAQLRNYQRLRALVDAWINAGMELSRLRLHRAQSSRTKIRGRRSESPEKRP